MPASGSTQMITAFQDRWEAAYFDGRSAHRQAVRVQLQSNGLVIEHEDERTSYWPYDQVRQTQGSYAGEQVRLEKGEGLSEVLVVADERFLSALQQHAPSSGKRFHDVHLRSRRLKLTVLAGVAGAVLAPVMYFWGVPAVAHLAATWIPVSWEERLGRSVATLLAPSERQCEGAEGAEALAALVDKLAGAIPDCPYTFRVTLAQDSMVNAFAAPGGYIVVYQGLLEKAKTAEELGGVLAHEMQHVLKRHSTRALFYEFSGQALLSMLSGDPAASTYGLSSVATLADLHYQRSYEDEADREGMLLLQRLQANPQGMIRMFETLAEDDEELLEGLVYLSTHPATSERIKALRKMAGQTDYSPVPLLSDEQWKALQQSCRSEGEPDGPHS